MGHAVVGRDVTTTNEAGKRLTWSWWAERSVGHQRNPEVVPGPHNSKATFSTEGERRDAGSPAMQDGTSGFKVEGDRSSRAADTHRCRQCRIVYRPEKGGQKFALQLDLRYGWLLLLNEGMKKKAGISI